MHIDKVTILSTYLSLLLLRTLITLRQKTILRNMIRPDLSKSFDIIPPVPMQLRRHCHPVHQLHAMLNQPLMRRFTRVFRERARAVGHHENVVALLDETEGGKRCADFGQDAAGNPIRIRQ